MKVALVVAEEISCATHLAHRILICERAAKGRDEHEQAGWNIYCGYGLYGGMSVHRLEADDDVPYADRFNRPSFLLRRGILRSWLDCNHAT